MYHRLRWTITKLEQRLALIESWVYRQRRPLPFFHYQPLDQLRNLSPEAVTGREIPAGGIWAAPDRHFLLWTTFTIPPAWRDEDSVVLLVDIGESGDFSHPEATLFIDKRPYAAVDRHHREVKLVGALVDDGEHELALLGWTGGTQYLRFDPTSIARPRQPLLMGESFLALVDEQARAFITLARVALGAIHAFDDGQPVRHHLLTALDEAFNKLDIRDAPGEGFYASIPQALAALQADIVRSGLPQDVDITAVGHAHIDIAWLWPVSQSRQKARNTFRNVLGLMVQFPDFVFAQSQAQLYEFVRKDDPVLFEEICKRVTVGQWEPLGGMWVEADCNLAGPEALVRQLLLGRTYFRRQFGAEAESPVLWLPDTFGFPWSLPQLAKEAGLDYFFTIKLGWNQYNRFPYDAFWWQGIDGSRILAHFGTTKDAHSAFAATYNARATPEQVVATWTNFQQKDAGPPGVTPPLLMAYGHGDGGGGPTREMIENNRLMARFPGLPRVQMGGVGDFFRKLEARVGKRLPVWNGELYLEYHRGVYTSQARIKRANRKNEFRLHDAEFLATWAALVDASFSYPSERLREAWRLLALNQFHDILPGTSIAAVYEDALQHHHHIAALATTVVEESLAILAEFCGGDWLVVNPTSFSRSDPVFLPHPLPKGTCPTLAGLPLAVQPVAGGTLVDVGCLSPYSLTPISIESYQQPDLRSTCIAEVDRLENDYLLVKFDEAGDTVRIFDKVRERDILPDEAIANQIQAFDDRARTPDAWDIDIYYDDKMWLAEPAESVRAVETGPLRATLEIKRRLGDSIIIQRISLHHNSTRLDFDTQVLWNERNTLLKAAFPLDILAPRATYEIPWGRIQRPTHRNTTWDWARFEVPAQKWADLSEGDYGVSLLNDCKYGYDIHDNVMRLTLLRAPSDPDPQADRGEHHFTYSLLPHAGPVGEDTLAAAYALNDPLIVAPGNGSPALIAEPQSFVAVDAANVVIETIKQAEDGRGIILRLFESQHQRRSFTLATSFSPSAAWRTNLLEEQQESITVADRKLQYYLRPFQILTLYLELP